MKKKHHHHRHHPSDKATDCGSKIAAPCCKPTVIGDQFEKLAEVQKKLLKAMHNKGQHLNTDTLKRVQEQVSTLQAQIDRIQEETTHIEALLKQAESADDPDEKLEAQLTEKSTALKHLLRQVSKKRPVHIDTRAVKAFLASHKCSEQRWEKHQHDSDRIQQKHHK